MREKTGKVTAREWEEKLKEFNHSCAYCGAKEKIEQDHIIPLSKGGSDNIENIQPLCKSCNSKKHTKTIKYKAEAAKRVIKELEK